MLRNQLLDAVHAPPHLANDAHRCRLRRPGLLALGPRRPGKPLRVRSMLRKQRPRASAAARSWGDSRETTAQKRRPRTPPDQMSTHRLTSTLTHRGRPRPDLHLIRDEEAVGSNPATPTA